MNDMLDGHWLRNFVFEGLKSDVTKSDVGNITADYCTQILNDKVTEQLPRLKQRSSLPMLSSQQR